jgi:D-alanyl-D-alanine carboxypeptidase (penicillin-binding protein 5/6)
MSRRLLPATLIVLTIAVAAVVGVVIAGDGVGAKPTRHPTDSELGLEQSADGPISLAGGANQLKLKLVGSVDPLRVKFKVPPSSGLLFDLKTGKVLWRHLPTKVLPIASVTKMMTALVVTDHLKPGSKVLITKQALNYQGSGVGVLPLGKRIGISAMLYGLLLPSGNDAAIALSQQAGGTESAFVADMNLRAEQMGLTCTHYSSPSGFYDAGNHSCAADLAVEAKAVLDNPRLAEIVKHRQAVLPFPIKGGKLYLYNHNELLKMNYPGTIGIKTGFTTAAGLCLVAAVQRGSRRYGLVLLHSPNPGLQAEQLFNRAFQLPASEG